VNISISAMKATITIEIIFAVTATIVPGRNCRRVWDALSLVLEVFDGSAFSSVELPISVLLFFFVVLQLDPAEKTCSLQIWTLLKLIVVKINALQKLIVVKSDHGWVAWIHNEPWIGVKIT